MAKITLHQGASIEETFKDFIISRKTKGLADKTIESYNYHFHAIAHHLDIYKDITDLTKSDLDSMIDSMRGAEISANSISTYTRCLRAFFSWCNEECITNINISIFALLKICIYNKRNWLIPILMVRLVALVGAGCCFVRERRKR